MASRWAFRGRRPLARRRGAGQWPVGSRRQSAISGRRRATVALKLAGPRPPCRAPRRAACAGLPGRVRALVVRVGSLGRRWRPRAGDPLDDGGVGGRAQRVFTIVRRDWRPNVKCCFPVTPCSLMNTCSAFHEWAAVGKRPRAWKPLRCTCFVGGQQTEPHAHAWHRPAVGARLAARVHHDDRAGLAHQTEPLRATFRAAVFTRRRALHREMVPVLMSGSPIQAVVLHSGPRTQHTLAASWCSDQPRRDDSTGDSPRGTGALVEERAVAVAVAGEGYQWRPAPLLQSTTSEKPLPTRAGTATQARSSQSTSARLLSDPCPTLRNPGVCLPGCVGAGLWVPVLRGRGLGVKGRARKRLSTVVCVQPCPKRGSTPAPEQLAAALLRMPVTRPGSDIRTEGSASAAACRPPPCTPACRLAPSPLPAGLPHRDASHATPAAAGSLGAAASSHCRTARRTGCTARAGGGRRRRRRARAFFGRHFRRPRCSCPAVADAAGRSRRPRWHQGRAAEAEAAAAQGWRPRQEGRRCNQRGRDQRRRTDHPAPGGRGVFYAPSLGWQGCLHGGGRQAAGQAGSDDATSAVASPGWLQEGSNGAGTSNGQAAEPAAAPPSHEIAVVVESAPGQAASSSAAAATAGTPYAELTVGARLCVVPHRSRRQQSERPCPIDLMHPASHPLPQASPRRAPRARSAWRSPPLAPPRCSRPASELLWFRPAPAPPPTSR